MAKKTAAELGLKQEPIQGAAASTEMDQLPDEFTMGPPPPYPGPYRFKTPSNFAALWDKFETDITDSNRNVLNGADGKPLKGVERISLVFDRDDPLVIEATPPSETHMMGQPFTNKINNRERNRAKKNEPALYVADLTYLLRAWDPKKPVPKSNQEFIQATLLYAGRSFGADVEWSTYCNEEKQIYLDTMVDASGQTVLAPEVVAPGTVVSQSPGTDAAGNPVKGCGTRYYMNDWKKGPDGRYLPRLRCKCNASLRPFGQLRNFRA